MVFQRVLPEFMGFLFVAFAVAVGVKEQRTRVFVEGMVRQNQIGRLQEDGFWIHEEELFERRCQGGEDPHCGGAALLEVYEVIRDEGFDVVGCDAPGKGFYESPRGGGEVGVAGVEDLDGEGGV